MPECPVCGKELQEHDKWVGLNNKYAGIIYTCEDDTCEGYHEIWFFTHNCEPERFIEGKPC